MRHALLVMVVIIALAGTVAPVRAEQDGPWQTYDTSAGEWRSYAGDSVPRRHREETGM